MSLFVIGTSGLKAQSCPGDNLPPQPGDASGVAQTTQEINDSVNTAIDVYLNKFGVGAIASDSGQFDPLTGSGARMYVEADFTLSGNDEVFTTATDSYVDGLGNTVLCMAPNSPKITASKTTFFCTDLGINTVTLTYTDAANNTSTRTVYINVIDPSTPVVVAQPATFALDATGTLTVSDADAADFNGGTYSVFGTDTGYCANNYTYSITPNTFDCTDLGDNTVTLTVTNPSNGASSTTTATIKVVDDLEPTITITNSSPTVQLDASGSAILFFADAATTADNCDGSPTVSVSPATFNCTQAGTTVQATLTSTDASGNVATATVDVNVEDNIAPVFAQTGSPSLGANGKVGLVDDTWYSVTENCNYTIVFTPDTLECSDINLPVSVAYVLTDGSGNSETGTVSVSPVDLLAPTVLTKDITVSLDDNGSYTLLPSEVDNNSFDNCTLDNATVTPNQFDCDDKGNQTVTLTWTDESGNSASETAVVTIEDNTPPNTVAISGQYILYSNQLLNGEISVTATVLNPTSTDNCEITDTVLTSLDSSLFYLPGQLINTFTCDDVTYTNTDGVFIDNSREIIVHNFDAEGNWSRDTATVILVDADAPSIIVQNANLALGADGTVDVLSDDYISATDECGVDSIWLSQTTFDCSDLGTQTIKAYARDIHNNADSVTLTVTVVDQLAPVVTVVQPSVTLYLDASTGQVVLPGSVSSYATALDNCTAPQPVVLSQTTFGCGDVGTNVITATATDAYGNSASENITVTIIDSVAPVLDINDTHVLQLASNGLASLTVGDVDVASSDNCGIVSRVLSQTSFDCDDIGMNTVTFTVSDAGGNSVSQSVSVTVEDVMDPVAVAQNLTIELDANGVATIDASDVDNGSSDNCGITSYLLSKTNFDCTEIGANTVTLTVADASGNTDQTTATITVEENISPLLELKASGDTLRLNQFGQRVVTVPGIIGDVSDNCTDVDDINISVSYTNTCNNVTKAGSSITLDCSDDSRSCATSSNPYDLRRFVITATDDEGNATIVTRDYFVIDLFAPNVFPKNVTLYLPQDISGNAQVVVDAGVYTASEAGTSLDPVGLDSATADACGISTKALLTSPSQNTPDQTLVYTCQDLGENSYFLRATDVYENRAAYEGKVTIVDTIKPRVTTQIANIYVDANGQAMLDPTDLIASASDNTDICGLDTTASRLEYVCINDLRWDATIVNPDRQDAQNINNWDTTGVISYVTDVAGNIRATHTGVRVMDTLPPVLIRQTIDVDLGPNNFVSLQNVQDTIIEFVSSDNCSLDPSRGGLARTYFDCDDVGPNSVTLTMFDEYGNSQQVQLNIIVHDRVDPVAKAQNIVVQLDVTGSASVLATSVDNGSTDNCGIVSYSLDKSTFDCSNVGVNTVTLTVTDKEGNTDVATAVVTVEDNIAPDLAAIPSAVTIDIAANGYASMDSAFFGNLVVEACAFNASFSVDSFDCSAVGTTQNVVYTVKDASNNSSSETIAVTVRDILAPVADVVATLDLYLDANGDATLDFEDDLNIGSYDNCSYVATLSQAVFGCADVNQIVTVTGTLTDPSGNTDAFTVDVTTRDTIAPVFATAQGDTTLYAVQYDCFAPFATGNNVPTFDAADQNCPGNITHYYQIIDANGNISRISEGSPIPVGVWTLNTVATDLQGNSSISSFNVTVIDTTLPTMQFINAPVIALGSNGQTTMTPAMLENSSYDNCGIESVTITPAVVDCDDLGTVTFTVTVEDWNTNTRTYQNITATVVDNEAPSITVEANPVVVNLDANGDASITPSDVVEQALDNCTASADIGLTVSPANFDCTDAGSVTVTITATDASGNTSVATKAVTVVDEIAPVITASDITLALGSNGSVALPLGTATATDNCSSASVEYSVTSFSCDDIGLNTVTVTSQDASGNTTVETFEVTLTDATNPVVTTVSSPVVVSLDASGAATISESDVVSSYSDNCGVASVVVSPTSFECSDLGSNTIQIVATDVNGNTTTATKTVTVVDNISPSVTVSSGAVALYLDANGTASVDALALGATATDNCTSSPVVALSTTSFTCAELGSNTITLTAADASGNVGTTTKSVTVYDTLSPVITVPSSLSLSIGSSGSVALGNPASATDNCGTPVITYSKSSFDCSDLGSNTITVTATDANGNSSDELMTVVVSDNIDPTLSLVASNVTLSLDAAGSAVLATSQVVSSATDNCSGVSVTVSPSTFGCADLGSNTVTVTVEDGSGNTTTATKTVTVVDNISPSVTVSSGAVALYLDANGTASVDALALGATATDNCTSSPVVALSTTSFTCAELGSNTITLTAADASGNVGTTTKSVTVYDTLSPVITVPSSLSLSIGSSGSVALGNPASATDNCGTPVITYSKSSFDCSDLGSNTITVTATDANGNSSDELMTVVVSDNIDPTLSLVASNVTLSLDAAGSAVLATSQVVSSATDNCSGVSVTVSPSTFGCADLGSNTVTVTVEDGSGNTTTATKTVTVVDNVDPVITIVSNPADVVLDATGQGTITAAMVASATDNCTATPTVTVTPTTVDCSDLGVVTVTVIASDANGNTTTASVPVNVVDNAAPVISSAQSDTTLAACDAQFNYAVNVSDNCSYTSTLTSGLASGSMFPVGSTTVSWEFSDASGNTVVHSFEVIVEPLGTYSLPVQNEFCADNGPVDLVNGQTGLVFSGAGVTAAGDEFQPAQAGIGSHTLDFVFTDANGCEQIGTWSVTVHPTPQQPTVVQMTPTTLESSEAGASYRWFRNGNRILGETNKDLFITQGGNYQVAVYNAFGCFRRSTGFVISSTGLSVEELLKDVTIYPNPTSSQVSVEFNWASESDLDVQLVDMLGRTMYKGSINKGDISHSIDMSSMTAGTYQLIIKDDATGNSTIERIIKVD